MKSTSALCLALAGLSHAYPNILEHLEQAGAGSAKVKRQTPLSTPPFDAASQYVDTTGSHAFQAPGPTDQRGPCPGLNALANHGYLPHNGIGTITQFIESTGKVFGMGVDLSTILAVYGAAVDGDGLKWSIGGPDSRVGLSDLLGKPQGISGSHNKYEGDGSPTRCDLYQCGNAVDLNMELFQELYDLGKAEDDYDLQLLTDRRFARTEQCKDENPYCFFAPFAGVIAQPAAWSFIYRFMSNKSEEFPSGKLNGEVLKSFYGVTGEDGNFQYNRGHERIPDNWYTRNIIDAYTVPYLNLDTNAMLLQHLEFASVGGNTGTTNSFVGLDPSDLTGGVFNAATLAEGNNLMCYGLQLALQQTPDLLSGVLAGITNSLGCPALTKIQDDQFDQFPGYTESYNGYTPPKDGIL
ncbi:hypothetical protein WHR41_03825 [Cladosporium halotolerans]|uniref:Heme haloperoxidase family profile domain-containing protein n=1 Tax=Cladosporium halotolerans TaxID=1052096 RepID=A0AB34KQY3_9PEZI